MFMQAFNRYLAALDTLEALLVKELGDESGAFGADLDALVTRSYRGRIGVASFAVQMDALLAEYIRAAYLEGLAEGGIEEDEADSADLQAINDMARAQREYVDGFAAAVMDAKREEDLRAQIDARIVMWGKSVRAAAVAGINSAKKNEIVIFAGQDGKENCPTCARLMGERHRRSWFADQGLVPGIPGNDNFECEGYQCEHFLAPVGAPVKGEKFNPNHDADTGEFSEGGGSGGGSGKVAETVKDYTTGGYKPLNAALRDDAPLTAKHREMVNVLDKAIADSPKLAKPITVYRGVNFGNQGMPSGLDLAMASRSEGEELTRKSIAKWAQDKFPAGHEFTLGGYQSTSFDTQPALDASLSRTSPGVIFKIDAKHGLHIKPSMSQYDDESELLLSRHTRYRVNKVIPSEEFETVNGTKVRRTVIHVEQI